MNKLEIIQERLGDVLLKKSAYNFPKLLKELRGCFGSTRRAMCKDIEIGEMRMFSLENGTFGSVIREYEIDKLAEYYGLDKNFLREKAICFVAERKGNAQVAIAV